MSKTKTKIAFFCKECGNESPRWQGQCPACKEWNTLVEEIKSKPARTGGISVHSHRNSPAQIEILEMVSESAIARINTGIPEFDFVLGGGIVPGSIVLIGGEPGIGKSTLTLQVLGKLMESGRKGLYVSGEESSAQVKMRAKRLGGEAIRVPYLGETSLVDILRIAKEENPEVLLIDSIQTIFNPDMEGTPGGVGQVRECAAQLQRFSKETGIASFLIGHVTKEGSIAGPRTLEHIVDTVVYFETAGDQSHRVLRAVKNRFGSLDEIGVFKMTSSGLEGVSNPSELFLAQRRAGAPGSAVVPLIEGSRPLLVEMQGLATEAAYGSPQRVANGFDHKRLAMLLAVLQKSVNYPFRQADVFLNVVGGLKVVEPSADMAVAIALASSFAGREIPPDAVFIGEIGLGGELRSVAQIERRISEAARMGFTSAYIPRNAVPKKEVQGIQIIGYEEVGELIETIVGSIEDIVKDSARD